MFALVVVLLILILIIAIVNSTNIEHVGAEANLNYYDFYGAEEGPFVCLIAGTHGNEPAGAITLEAVAHELRTIKRGHLRIIPRVNIWGLDHHIRYKSFLTFLPDSDINRNYNTNGGRDSVSRRVLELVRGADLVVDFHEGWGYHVCQPNSVGSTASPTTFEPAPTIADEIARVINADAPNTERCPFIAMPNASCDISTTLACYMQKNHRPYILIETTGQNNIQPMATRDRQIRAVVRVVLQHAGYVQNSITTPTNAAEFI